MRWKVPIPDFPFLWLTSRSEESVVVLLSKEELSAISSEIKRGKKSTNSQISIIRIFFQRPTVRTHPVFGHIFPTGSSRNPFFRQDRTPLRK